VNGRSKFEGSRFCLAMAFLAWLVGGLGGVLGDFDHFLSVVSKGAVPWGFLHTSLTVGILSGLAVALLGGLLLTMVLRQERRNDKDTLG